MSESRAIGKITPQSEQGLLLQKLADEIRLSAMTMTNHSGVGHTGGDLSSADILATLYLGNILSR
jgi:transketolase N-terminal domain/subunit